MTVNTVVTGLAWMGTGVRSVQSALRDMLQSANQEVFLCAYSISSGANEILSEFERCLQRGVKLTVIINRFEEQPKDIQTYFLKLKSSYSYCKVYDFKNDNEELHAKLVVVDRAIALVGSANLSMRGMRQNYELGIILRDSEVQIINQCVDALLNFSSVIAI